MSYLFVFIYYLFTNRSYIMKIRHILAIIAFIVIATVSLDRVLKPSDYRHCLATTKLSKSECGQLTGYIPE
nr:MAG TPA: hypothetical protein [Caudoviricetes sp.]